MFWYVPLELDLWLAEIIHSIVLAPSNQFSNAKSKNQKYRFMNKWNFSATLQFLQSCEECVSIIQFEVVSKNSNLNQLKTISVALSLYKRLIQFNYPARSMLVTDVGDEIC